MKRKMYICDACKIPILGSPTTIKCKEPNGYDGCMTRYRMHFHYWCWRTMKETAKRLADQAHDEVEIARRRIIG